MNRQNVTKWCHEFSERSSTTKMRCKKKSWRVSKGGRHTSMTRGYRSWFQDLINVWTMPTTMLQNKVMYRQFIHIVAFVNQKCCTCLGLLYLYFPVTPRRNGNLQPWRERLTLVFPALWPLEYDRVTSLTQSQANSPLHPFEGSGGEVTMLFFFFFFFLIF